MSGIWAIVDMHFSITDAVHCEAKHFIQKCRVESVEKRLERLKCVRRPLSLVTRHLLLKKTEDLF